MKVAWFVQGIGYLIILGALFYLLSAKEVGDQAVIAPEEASNVIIQSNDENGMNIEEGMQVRSPAFAYGGIVPSKYTCDGDNISPPLAIDHVPQSTVSLVLIVEDPDVPRTIRADGMWDHWTVFNIPPNTLRIGEGEAPQGVPGTTTSGNTQYGGPCPPDGEHRYMFRVYALDTQLQLDEGATKVQVLEAMEGHVIENATLMARYTRIAQ